MKIIIFLLIALMFFSCKKEEDTKKKFTLTYKVKINDVNNQLSSCQIYTNTIFPDDEWKFLHFSYGKHKDAFDDSHYLYQYDSLFYTPDVLIYDDCNAQMEVYVYIKNKDSEKVKIKKYLIEEKIENLKENKTILFNWPSDTISAIEVIE